MTHTQATVHDAYVVIVTTWPNHWCLTWLHSFAFRKLQNFVNTAYFFILYHIYTDSEQQTTYVVLLMVDNITGNTCLFPCYACNVLVHSEAERDEELYTSMYKGMYVCMYVSVSICMCVCMGIHMCLSTGTHVSL